MTDRITEIRARVADATPGPWQTYNGCSWWRIGTDEGNDCAVLYPCVDRYDGHPNLSSADPGRFKANLEFIAHAREDIPYLLSELDAARAENERLRHSIAEESREIEQALGAALGHPWYKDDPKNFPDATEEDGVCVGDHVPASLAAEAARHLSERNAEIERLRHGLVKAAAYAPDIKTTQFIEKVLESKP